MYLLYPIADKSKILQEQNGKIHFCSKQEPVYLQDNSIKLRNDYLGYNTNLVSQSKPFKWTIDIIATRSKTGHYVPSSHTLIVSLRVNDSYLNYFREDIELIKHDEIELKETLDLYRMGWETEHVGKIWILETLEEIDEQQALVDIINTFDQKELQEMMDESASIAETEESVDLTDTSDLTGNSRSD
ncbi:hypothetical protein HDV04_003030 [Boothiomyces sp. JEL0838]|nr:hypothetical protein HDV04_003030 [Boothiomyces sp. JEL0838]